LSINGLRNNK